MPLSKATYSNSYIHSCTDGGGCHARCRPPHQGFSILPSILGGRGSGVDDDDFSQHCSVHCVLNFHSCIFVICFSLVSRHSTSKLSWSECMDFSDTQIHNITDLRGLKRFLNRGFYLRIEEEKV